MAPFPYKRLLIDGKQVLEHRYKMEKKLGRKLTKDEIVHHKDEIPRHNRLKNLKLTNIHDHSRYHLMKRQKKAEYILLKCSVCKKKFKRCKSKHLWKLSQGVKDFYCSKSCAGKVNAKYFPHEGKENNIYSNQIKKGLSNGWSGYKISKEYNINHATVYNHLKKLSYVHINRSRYKDGEYRCPGCNKYLSKENFHKVKSKKHGIDSYCKNCKKIKNKGGKEWHQYIKNKKLDITAMQ